jgi:hypothetical protein
MGLTADKEVTSPLSTEDERARKRQAIGLSARRPTAREAVHLPPEEHAVESSMWTAVLLLVGMCLATGWMVYDAVAGAPSTSAVEQHATHPIIDDDFTAPQLALVDSQIEGVGWTGFRGDSYQILVEKPGHLSWSTLGLLDLSTYRLETALTVGSVTEATPFGGYAGLVVRYANPANFYLFTTNGRGAYQVQLQKDEQWRILQPWTPATALQPGEEANVLAVEDDGAEIRFYANEELLFAITDPRLPGGDVGFAGGTQSQGSVLAVFEWVKLYAVPTHPIQ